MKAYKYGLIILMVFQSITFSNAVDKTKTFKVAPGGVLALSVNLGEVKISTWDKNEVQVTVKGLYDEDSGDLKISQDKNNIEVRFNGGWSDPDEITFIVNVPVNFNQEIKTLAGDITVIGDVKGNVKLFTQGGDIKTGSISGNTAVNTLGGDISAGSIQSNAEISTAGGDILLSNISGNADISTMGGDITVSDISKKANIKTHGGDIRVGNIGGDADIFTFGGDIIVKYISGNSKLNTYGGDIKTDGAKGIVTAKSNGGDLTLLNVTGAVEANTNSGDIIVELISDNTNNSKIVTHNGSITLSINDKAKAEITASARFKGSYNDDDEMDISSEFKPKSHEKNSRSIKNIYILNGGGINISLQSTNSGIIINKLVK